MMSELIYAVKTNNFKIIESIINSDNVNTMDEWGDTLIHLSVKAGNIKMIELLLHHSPDLTIENNDGMTSIDFAIESNNVKIITVLLPEYKAVVSVNSLASLNKIMKTKYIKLNDDFISKNINNILSNHFFNILTKEIKDLFIF